MTDRVASWLRELGLEQYAPAFAANDIDWELLFDLDQETLRAIGVESAGHRIRLLKAIAALRPEDGIADAPASPALGSTDADLAGWSRTPGERKPVTMLFADTVGSTSLTEKLDPEDAHDRLYRATQVMCRAVESNGGTVCRFMGDGIMAMFGAPVASERHALEACRAALDLQTGIREYARELHEACGAGIEVRVGLHSGEVVVLDVGDNPDKPEYDASGPTVPLAARLEQSAAGGSILISAQTRALAGDLIGVGAHPPVPVKGFSEPVEVFELERIKPVGEADVVSSPMVGRRAELAQFRGLLEACAESGHGEVIFIRGEAGIGKTRLIEELARLAGSRGFSTHKSLVLDFGTGKGQGAISSLVRSLIDIAPGSGKRARAAALDRAQADGLVGDDQRVFLNDLLDLPQPLELKTLYDAMEVDTRKEGKRAALIEILLARAVRRPLFIVIEDLHWADGITLDYLARIALAVADCPALMVLTSRFEGDPIDSAWRATAGDIPFVTCDLGPLRREEATELVSAFIDSSDELARRCIERAAGNPLFLNQLLLSIDRGGAESIPDSIKSLVLARMDHLPADDKQAMQAAAVLGQRFDLDGLRYLIGDDEYECGLLVERHLVRPEGPQYLFAHALIQEGAYSSLLNRQRKALHGRAAEWYRDYDLALHAEHLENAGDPAAAKAYLDAAREQLTLYRPERAKQLVHKGLAIDVDEQAFSLHCLDGELHRFLGNAAESIESYRRALELAAGEVERCRALVGIAEGLVIIEDHEQLLQVLGEAEALATRNDLVLELAIINQLQSGVYFFQADYERCLAAGEKSLNYARRADSPEVLARALSGLADAEYSRGRIGSAHDYFDQCIEVAQRHGLGRVIAANLSMRGIIKVHLYGYGRAREDMDEAMRLALQTKHLRAETIACYCARYEAEAGNHAEANRLLRRAIEICRQIGSRLLEGAYLYSLARSQYYAGKREQARATALEAISCLQSVPAGRTFRVASAYSTLALVTEDPEERDEALAAAETILVEGCLGHNYFDSFEDSISACINANDWDRAEHYAGRLEEYNRHQPSERARLVVAWARLLGRVERGESGAELGAELEQLSGRLRDFQLLHLLPNAERAISVLTSRA